MGVCHGADAVVWWCSAFRTHGSPDEEERRKVLRFLEPFGRFIYDGEDGNGIGWGTKSEREVREMGVDGEVRVVEDEGWERGLRVWDMMWKAHEEKVTNDL